MPHTKGAAKRMRTSEEKRQSNRSTKSRLTSVRREFLEAVTAGDKSKSAELLKSYASHLDKAVKHGVIPANNADRHKSRAAEKIKA